MGILEDINNMKAQGLEDAEIAKKLKEKGANPKSIEDAFNQLRIKNAISAEYGEEGMEPSIMKNPPAPSASPLYTPKTQEIEHDTTKDFYSPQPGPPQFAPQYNPEFQAPAYANTADYQEQYVPQEGYSDQMVQGMSASFDTDSIIEIAEQVFSEKIKKEQKQLDALNEFATLVETKITNDHERIKRIETIIDKLQIAILEKIGSYGKNIESIKDELGMMQESFEKMVPILHEKSEEKKPTRQRR